MGCVGVKLVTCRIDLVGYQFRPPNRTYAEGAPWSRVGLPNVLGHFYRYNFRSMQ